jgi:A/G-specific adenine glycosylase
VSRYKEIHAQLLHWYKKEGRHSLPWRNTDDIYHVYLSEIMLQQTQVNRVRDEYYPQFLAKFPSLKALGDAPLDEVLSAWSGLGYYRRAKNLHNAAKLVKNTLPQTIKELKALPGIGDYTASAICCFGLWQSVPVVDTNIARVLKRYFALLNLSDKITWETANNFLNSNDPRSHNLALMDLGSMVCLPKNPKCEECPLCESCQGKEEAEIYTKVKKKEYISMELFFGVYIKQNKIALQVSQDNMYKDMLVLPSVDPIEEKLLGSFKHAYTKYKLDVKIYEVEELEGEFIWVDLDKFNNAPISSLSKKAKKFF